MSVQHSNFKYKQSYTMINDTSIIFFMNPSSKYMYQMYTNFLNQKRSYYERIQKLTYTQFLKMVTYILCVCIQVNVNLWRYFLSLYFYL